MSAEEKVLDAMVKAGTPVGTTKVVELTGLDRKEVEKAMKTLKDSGKIVSPKRCVWEPAK
ncbi:MAG: MarR family transcriptional regulator [Prevotellaceae bacterium]|jgi:biotin operon repressor|nr:MarR family transcriptional regulator [Prevotellaceae bacterium]